MAKGLRVGKGVKCMRREESLSRRLSLCFWQLRLRAFSLLLSSCQRSESPLLVAQGPRQPALRGVPGLSWAPLRPQSGRLGPCTRVKDSPPGGRAGDLPQGLGPAVCTAAFAAPNGRQGRLKAHLVFENLSWSSWEKLNRGPEVSRCSS